jgi:hypothetical protein
MELVFEMRELEAAGDSTAGEITVSGPRIVHPPPPSSEGHLFFIPSGSVSKPCFYFLRQCFETVFLFPPAVFRIRIRIQEGKNNPQKYNIVTNKFHAFF